jgi:MurNAc alpha-1-phosphate uridylyltransferase
MKVNTALILCAGYGKRLNPITLKTPKPLLKLNNISMLENCINLIISLGIKKILINTFHLSHEIFNFLKSKNFSVEIEVIEDGKKILDTGGGILNMISHSNDENFLIFNPDTLWTESYKNEINKMQNLYFKKKLKNILLLTNKKLSFDKNLNGDFELKNHLLKKQNDKKDLIYIGCQILNKDLFRDYKVVNFSIKDLWDEQLKKCELNGFESFNKFYHLTDLKTFKKLKDL